MNVEEAALQAATAPDVELSWLDELSDECLRRALELARLHGHSSRRVFLHEYLAGRGLAERYMQAAAEGRQLTLEDVAR